MDGVGKHGMRSYFCRARLRVHYMPRAQEYVATATAHHTTLRAQPYFATATASRATLLESHGISIRDVFVLHSCIVLNGARLLELATDGVGKRGKTWKPFFRDGFHRLPHWGHGFRDGFHTVSSSWLQLAMDGVGKRGKTWKPCGNRVETVLETVVICNTFLWKPSATEKNYLK